MSRMSESALAAIAAQHNISLPKGGVGQRVDVVQVDGLALLKILKHARENSLDGASGPLLGLVVDHVLEITNCFPFPTRPVGDEAEGTQTFQIEMLRCLREVNIDHLQVGWYTSAPLGAFLNGSNIQDHFEFQSQTEESICLVYDPVRTQQGALSIRAFRLTDKYMELHKSGNFSVDKLNQEKLTSEKIFEEIPVTVKSSSLARMLLNELDAEDDLREEFERLDLSSNSYLEKNLRQLMSSIDELSQEQQKLFVYKKEVAKRKQLQQQYLNKMRLEREKNPDGEPAEPEDLSNHPHFQPIPPPSRLDSMLIEGQINHYCSQLSSYASASTSKLFVTQALQDE